MDFINSQMNGIEARKAINKALQDISSHNPKLKDIQGSISLDANVLSLNLDGQMYQIADLSNSEALAILDYESDLDAYLEDIDVGRTGGIACLDDNSIVPNSMIYDNASFSGLSFFTDQSQLVQPNQDGIAILLHQTVDDMGAELVFSGSQNFFDFEIVLKNGDVMSAANGYFHTLEMEHFSAFYHIRNAIENGDEDPYKTIRPPNNQKIFQALEKKLQSYTKDYDFKRLADSYNNFLLDSVNFYSRMFKKFCDILMLAPDSISLSSTWLRDAKWQLSFNANGTTKTQNIDLNLIGEN